MVPEDLSVLRRLYLGFIGSRVVLTANNLGIFDMLNKPRTAADSAKRLKADERAMEILLDALTGIGLVQKDKDGKYRNSPVSSRYLVKGAQFYQGDIVRHASSMWENFSALDEVVKTGNPARRAKDHESFILGMHNLTVLRADSLVNAVGLSGVNTMLDLGGGPGTNAMAMAKRGVEATVFDLPETITIAKKLARKEKIKGLDFISGDFHSDFIGSGYDLILLSQIFHAFTPEENLALLEKCRTALNPGGRVIVHEFPINDAHTLPPQSALFSVNMLVATKGGRCYTPREISNWLSSKGFKNIKTKKLDETVLIEGRLKDR